MDELEALRKKRMSEILEEKNKMDKTIELSDDGFEGVVSKHSLVVADLWAPWCGPCRMLAPVIEELAAEYSGKVVFGKLNVDDNQDTASKFEVMSIPTLLFFKDGHLVDRVVGALPKQVLKQKIDNLI
ncbi:MAG: thioredoxin [Candidatus Altiarchaeota archaeon]|nr:thioredoxin [Candidatus Altiarchaeota archaeon]